jgi:hypothetical protein
MPSGGTALTVSLAREAGKPCLVVDLDYPPSPAIVREWLRTHRIDVLNVAGPRESTNPGIYYAAQQYLRDVLADPMCPSRAAEEPRP